MQTGRSNFLFLLIGALVAAVAVLGYLYHQDSQTADGLEIDIGSGGVTVDVK